MVLIYETENVALTPTNLDYNNFDCLNGLKIISQNTNSLSLALSNVEKKRCNFSSKINAILKNRSDIIMLQDIRVNNHLNILERELKSTQFGSFNLYVNSNKSERGVAFIINSKCNLQIYKIHRSNDNNIIILDASFDNLHFLLVNIYAPTQQADRNFFKDLKDKISSLNNKIFIICGDYNAVPNLSNQDLNGFQSNIELLNMKHIPNIGHSKEIVDWIKTGFAIERFRTLYPNDYVYSYSPFDKTAINKSRIDLTYSSLNFSRAITKIEYLPITSTLFDHKCMVISLGYKKIFRPKTIDKNLLDIDNLFESVKFSVMEFLVENVISENENQLKEHIREITSLSISCQLLTLSLKLYPNDCWIKNLNDYNESRLRDICLNFPSYDELTSYEWKLPPDIFVEMLLNVIKNSCISFQSNYIKTLREQKEFIAKELLELQSNNIFTSQRVKDLERELGSIEDKENERILQNSIYFSVMNHEKPSKHTSELLKNNKKSESLNKLKDNNGLDFTSNENRNKFITNHFKGIFGKKGASIGSIEDFLDMDMNHPLIKEHQLNDIEKNNLDSPFTIEELDASLDSANLCSSAGPDGFPMRAMKTFWILIRKPMLKAFNFMIDKGELTKMMCVSNITLIPKGGKDLSKMKGWRPIASLTSMYKLFSGIVSLRIRKVIEKISVPCQKAYSKEFTIHENLLCMIENISKSIDKKCPLATLIIDFSSAFDSINHEYVKKCFKFFNFGPHFCKIIDTILDNRRACILTDDGLTELFYILCGIFQGDRPSPDFFKICATPLLIKFLTTPQLELPRELSFKHNNIEIKPSSNLAFADDLNQFFKPTSENILKCVEILKKFATLSNLEINESKTKVLITGGAVSQDFLDTVNNLGFCIEDEVEILGMKVDNKLLNIDQNWSLALDKIYKIKNFWSLFFLSVAGKINIIKTYFFSQLTYLGTILNPPPDFIQEFESIIVSFINSSQRIAKNRIFEDVELGGLGIFKVKPFIQGLQLGFFKRGLRGKDKWGLELKSFFDIANDPLSLDLNRINFKVNPILYNISSSFVSFKHVFWEKEGNILDARILNNVIFKDSFGNTLTNQVFTRATWLSYNNKISTLVLSDFLKENNSFSGYDYFKRKNNIDLPILVYRILTSFILPIFNKIKKNFNKENTKFDDFFKKKNLRSKDFRVFLSSTNFQIKHCRPSVSRYNWIDIVLNPKRESRFISMWNLSFLTINLRDFIFKMVNNKLAFNANVHHFSNIDISQECTLCILSKLRPTEKETSLHIFVRCPTSSNIINEYFDKFLEHSNIPFNINFCLIGAPDNLTYDLSMILNIEIFLVCFFIYKCKCKRKLPLSTNLHTFIQWYKNSVLHKNIRYQKAWTKWLAVN